MITVVLYDDNKGRLEGLELLINANSDMKCIGKFENCSNIIEEVVNLHPNVILMDIDMPYVNGIEGLKMVREHAPHILIIMQTIFDEENKIFEAIKAGANGYFLKKTPPIKLIEGIREVFEGGAPMSSSIAKKVLEFYRATITSDKNTNFKLTERETQILSLLMKGNNYKNIAELCQISWHTVNSHCKNIYEKLHVHSASEAVAKAIKQNIF